MDNKITEAIVLAGGLGTRLRSEIGEFPKPMAPIKNQPFLHYLMEYLQVQGVEKIILSVGFKWKMIKDHFGEEFHGIPLEYVVEEEPLGTGGGIRLALEHVQGDKCFVVNGDTYFRINLKVLERIHHSCNSNCTLALKEMRNVDRYGSVELKGSQIVAFHEKRLREETIINGGIYVMNKRVLDSFEAGSKFSFEQDYLENNTASKNIHGEVFDAYFMDIGIPSDYRQFEKDMT